jgi:succinate-acetate transporter protein
MQTNVGNGGSVTATRQDPTAGRIAEARAAGSWTVADPGPLGLAAFALTTFVLSMLNAGLVGIFTAYMFIASLRTTAAIATVFLLLTATFVVLGIGDASAGDSITKLGGFIGLAAAAAAAAWYASFAEVTKAPFGRTVLPVKPLTR